MANNTKTQKAPLKDYGRWDRTPIKVTKSPAKKVKRGK